MIHRSSILHCACRLVLLKTKYSLGPPKDCHFLLLSIMFQHLFYLIFIDTIYFIMVFFIIIDIFVLH
jgi:hypothetical protein